MSIAYVTTSWDDGHPLDLRLAETLAASGVTGTFYVPIDYPPMPRMTSNDMRRLMAMGFEIGSHSLTHPRLDRVDEDVVRHELSSSKKTLEDLIGAEVTALCYPFGNYNPRVMQLAREAGYTLARTTVSYRTSLDFDPHAMPVSYQLQHHSKFIHARHAIKVADWRGLMSWIRLGCASKPAHLAERCFARAKARGGVYHLWGHSWEVEQHDLWLVLSEILGIISKQSDIRYVTNSQLVCAISV